jgi:hypothetical protein
MRFLRFLPLIALLAFSACTNAVTATPTQDNSGLPHGTPVGLLPGTAEPSAEPPATLEPVDLADSQRIDTPELGLQFSIPSSWTADHAEELVYVIHDQDGTVVMQVSYAGGFAPDATTMEEEMGRLLLERGLKADEFTVKQSVVGVYNYVVVSGPGIDACEYRYILAGLSWLAIKFERPMCDDGGLNDTAFTILRSFSYKPPTK